MDLKQLYETNIDFHEYVDKHCKYMKKSVEDALQDAVVREYAEWLVSK